MMGEKSLGKRKAVRRRKNHDCGTYREWNGNTRIYKYFNFKNKITQNLNKKYILILFFQVQIKNCDK